ncbi:MAG: Hsp70 family protein [Myxococcales bacterium]|nr:Hsp70 family protein [Myxococcales bacterium]
MSTPIVGIDLGTTNSLVGAIVDGKVRLFADAGGALLVPSVVGRSPEGEILVGRRARNRRLLDPEGTVRSIKRQMGRDVKVRVGKESLRPPEVSALILAALLDIAERGLGIRPAQAVVTVPAYFDEHQRQATLDAGELAGLDILRLVNEPTAAALAEESGAEELVLVYDLGGGTFDVSVLERDEGFMEVRASHGDTALGGDDVDQALLELVLGRLGPEGDIVRREVHGMTRLAEAVERAKIALSTATDARILEPFLAGSGSSAVNLDLELSRADLEAVAGPLIERTLGSVEHAIREARVRAADFDRILLVGGASQMPLVAQRLSEQLDMPVQLAEAPDRAVAAGAARLAGRAAGLEVEEVLIDVTPFTLAAGVISAEYEELSAAPVIARGTVIPVTRQKTYYTGYEDQPMVDVPVCQGDAALFYDNTQLGEVHITDLPPSPEASPVDVTFKLDLSGVLHVSATHRPSGRQASVTIKRGPTQLTARQRVEAKARVEGLRAQGAEAPSPAASSPEDPSSASAPSPTSGDGERRLASSLLARAGRALEGPAGDEAARERVRSAAATLRTALDGGDDFEDALEALTDALYDFEG